MHELASELARGPKRYMDVESRYRCVRLGVCVRNRSAHVGYTPGRIDTVRG